LSKTDTVKVSSLDNPGTLDLIGGATADREMALDVAGPAGFGAAGELSGVISLAGYSGIIFASGGITGIEVGAALTLNGADAFIADAGAATPNSALFV
jgi:hypothetical protein